MFSPLLTVLQASSTILESRITANCKCSICGMRRYLGNDLLICGLSIAALSNYFWTVTISMLVLNQFRLTWGHLLAELGVESAFDSRGSPRSSGKRWNVGRPFCSCPCLASYPCTETNGIPQLSAVLSHGQWMNMASDGYKRSFLRDCHGGVATPLVVSCNAIKRMSSRSEGLPAQATASAISIAPVTYGPS